MRPKHQLLLLALGVCLLGSACNHRALAASIEQESGKEIEKLVKSDKSWMQQLRDIVENIKSQWDKVQSSSEKTATVDKETNLLEFLIVAVRNQSQLLKQNKYSETEIPISGSANRKAPLADCDNDAQSSCNSNNLNQSQEEYGKEADGIRDGDGESRVTGQIGSGSSSYSSTEHKLKPAGHRNSVESATTDPIAFRKEQFDNAIRRSNSFLKDVLDNELQALAFNLIANKLTGDQSNSLKPIQQSSNLTFKLVQYLVGLLVDFLSAVFGRKLDVGYSGAAAVREHTTKSIVQSLAMGDMI